MRVLDDADIDRLATPGLVAGSMRRAVLAAWRGELLAPPRGQVDLGERRLSFACGAVPGKWYGYRSYVAPGSEGDQQVVVVQDEGTGEIRGLSVGRSLGPRRVGGIGALALDLLAPEQPDAIALVGAGTQAWHQLWALPERFRGLPVLVHSRTPAHLEAFVDRARTELGLEVHAARDAPAAARDAGIVVMATSSPTPVLQATDVRPGAYVATLGPKQVGRAEFAPELAHDAALVVSDSPAQVLSYDPPNVLVGSGVDRSLVHLGAVVAGEQEVPDGTRVFFSVGLAGTEAWLLNDLVTGEP